MFQSVGISLFSDMAVSGVSVRMAHLSCPLCQEMLRSPATIPCGHTFCSLCIQDFWDNEEKHDRFCSCPECQYTFHQRPNLIKNIALAEMVEAMEKSRWRNNVGSVGKHRPAAACHQAGPSPSQTQEKARPMKSPQTTTVSEAPKSRVCPTHGRLLEVYCCDDDQCICLLCALVEHKSHSTLFVNEGWSRKQVLTYKLKSVASSIPRVMCILHI